MERSPEQASRPAPARHADRERQIQLHPAPLDDSERVQQQKRDLQRQFGTQPTKSSAIVQAMQGAQPPANQSAFGSILSTIGNTASYLGQAAWSALFGQSSPPAGNAAPGANAIAANQANQPAPQQGGQVGGAVVPAAAITPGAIRQRLVDVQTAVGLACRTLPIEIRRQWADPNEPAWIGGPVQAVYLPIQRAQQFANPADGPAADQQTLALEQTVAAYTAYCQAVAAALQQVNTQRAAYQAVLPNPDLQFAALCASMDNAQMAAAVTQNACQQYLQYLGDHTAHTNAGLKQLLAANPAHAGVLVAQYFAQGRLRIHQWRIGYASRFDAKRNHFGAEWTLRAIDPRLNSIAEHWVFHTHATVDAAGNITISRAMGASHIKPAAAAQALGGSIDFVDDAEFRRAETDPTTLQSFTSWVRRTGADSLRNTNRRQ